MPATARRMIPTETQAKALWEKYNLPQNKRRHVMLVAQIARFLGRRLRQTTGQSVNLDLVCAGALLHDIDKKVSRLRGEAHPDAAVRILQDEGVGEVADLVKTHPLHAILDPTIAPKTWEEKILFLADKMVKLEIITVDKRFELWNKEHLPEEARRLLTAAYPKVKALEKEIFSLIRIEPDGVKNLLEVEAASPRTKTC